MGYEQWKSPQIKAQSSKLKVGNRESESEIKQPAATGASTAGQQSTIQTSILEVVSNLTGYPVEMLNLDMDIEADLGIDSIKRVEILSTDSLFDEIEGIKRVDPRTGHSLN